MKAQRLRVTFSRGGEMRYITHLDMMRFWERALRRAASTAMIFLSAET